MTTTATKREHAVALLRELYPPAGRAAATDRLRDLQRRRDDISQKLTNAEGRVEDIDTFLADAAKDQLSEFIEGERVRQYDDAAKLRHLLNRLNGEIEQELEFIRRHGRATELMRG